jgi:F-type H+-transporting ATPase subunit epsilon
MSEEVDMVVVPGAEGDFGVIAEHAPVISTVRPGTITVYRENSVSDRIFVAGGFAEVTAERCTVLAEEAEPLDEIDRSAVEGQMRDLREDLGMARSDEERALIEGRIAVAEAKIEALGEQVYQ